MSPILDQAEKTAKIWPDQVPAHEINQTDQIDGTDQRDHTDQINQAHEINVIKHINGGNNETQTD